MKYSLIFSFIIGFTHSIKPMFKRTFIAQFYNHNPTLDSSALGLFNKIKLNAQDIKKNYKKLHYQYGLHPHVELLYRADCELYNICVLMTKCNALYRDDAFVKAMTKDSSLQNELKQLQCDLQSDRIKIETFMLFVKKMQQSGPLG